MCVCRCVCERDSEKDSLCMWMKKKRKQEMACKREGKITRSDSAGTKGRMAKNEST